MKNKVYSTLISFLIKLDDTWTHGSYHILKLYTQKYCFTEMVIIDLQNVYHTVYH